MDIEEPKNENVVEKTEKRLKKEEVANLLKSIECGIDEAKEYTRTSSTTGQMEAAMISAAQIGNSSSILISRLRKQLEFYLGDPNLLRDNHLRALISKHKKGYVDLKHFLGFKKIDSILAGFHIVKFDQKMDYLRQAIKSSQVLKICKQNQKVKRLVKFSESDVGNQALQAEMDARTIYIENLPESCSRETLASIFGSFGPMLYISLPKKEGVCRGYGFIEFCLPGDSEQALKVDNSIPRQLMEGGGEGEAVQALRVMTKGRWRELKQEFKALKASLTTENLQKRSPHVSKSQILTPLSECSIIKLENVPTSISKNILATILKHVCEIIYVDKPLEKDYCFLRVAKEDESKLLAAINRPETGKNLKEEETTNYFDSTNQGLVIQGHQVTAQVLDEAETNSYHKKVEEKRQKFKANKEDKEKKAKSAKQIKASSK